MPPSLPIGLTRDDPHHRPFTCVLHDELMAFAATLADVGHKAQVLSEVFAHRTPKQETQDGVGQTVRHPEAVVTANHGGPRTDRIPWRPARISKTTSTSACTMMNVLTTAAMVPEPPVAALVPTTAS